MDSPYNDLKCEKLILRDHLAIGRTILANERTLLAYIRTALALLVVAFTLIKFFHTEFYEFVGWALVPTGIGTLAFGIWRYRHINRLIREAEGTTQGGGQD